MSTRGGKSGKKRKRSTRAAGPRGRKLSRAAIRKKVVEGLKGVRKELDEMVEAGNAGGAVEKVWGLLVDSMSESSTVAYGKQSEKSDADQLRAALEHAKDEETKTTQGEDVAPGGDDEILDTPDLTVDKKPDNARKTNRHNHGRKKLPKSLPTRVEVIPVPDAERECPNCGSEMATIGYATSEVLEFIPAHFERVEYRREKCACGPCRGGGVVTAPEADKPYDNCLAGPGLLASIVVSKFSDHLPLTRLQRIYARHGARIAVSTMAGWLERLLPVVEPLYDRMWDLMLESDIIQHDATGLKVLDHTTDDNIRRGTIWCYVGDYKMVVFRYAPNGKGISGPWTWLKGIDCYLQSDAANVFDRLHNGKVASAANVGCWFHARRRFFKLIDKEPDAAKTVVLIRKLYATEAKADAAGLDPEARKALRQKESRPLLGRFRAWLDLKLKRYPPRSALGAAYAYLDNHWDSLNTYLEDGRLKLDNNLCEGQIRDVALGRKNFLFAGSDAGAHRLALYYSLMRSCALNKVSPFEYLRDVIIKLSSGWPDARIDELLPHLWVAPQHAEEQPQSYPT